MGRPIGVALVAILVALRGISMLIGGFLGMSASRALFFTGSYIPSSSFGFWSWLAILVAIGILCVAYGLWNMQRWGWTWTVVFLVIALLLDVVYLIDAGTINWLGFAIGVIALIYLFLPNTKKWFFQY